MNEHYTKEALEKLYLDTCKELNKPTVDGYRSFGDYPFLLLINKNLLLLGCTLFTDEELEDFIF